MTYLVLWETVGKTEGKFGLSCPDEFRKFPCVRTILVETRASCQEATSAILLVQRLYCRAPVLGLYTVSLRDGRTHVYYSSELTALCTLLAFIESDMVTAFWLCISRMFAVFKYRKDCF